MNKFCDNYVKNGVIFKDKDEQILNKIIFVIGGIAK